MCERRIHRLIKWGISGVAVGLLCAAFMLVLPTVSWELLKVHRGRLSGPLGWTQGFFFQLGLLLTPCLAFAAPIIFSAEGLFAARLVGKRRYWAVFVGPLVYVELAMVMLWLFLLVVQSKMSNLSHMWLALFYPRSALSIFGFWLPAVATGLYCRLSKHPRWWLSGYIGTLTLIAGVLFWALMGVLVGAETD